MSRAALLGVAALAVVAVGGRPAAAKGCHETSYVVGHEHCTRFGTWSRDQPGPALVIDIGFVRHRFESEPFSLGTGALTAAPTRGQLATVSADPMANRILFGIGRLFYAGADFDMGWLSTVPRGSGAPATSGILGEAHAIGGIHIAEWRVSVGAELAVGGRFTALTPTTAMGQTVESTFATSREIEGRATIDFWMTPHLSLGAGVGKSLIATDDTRFFLYFGGHLKAMDGMR